MTKTQETDTGTFFFVSQENQNNLDSPSSDVGEYKETVDQEPLRQAYSADNLSSESMSRQARIRTIKQGGQPVPPPRRRSNRAEIVSISQSESVKPKHRYSFNSVPTNVFSKAASLKRGSAPITCEGSRERLASNSVYINRHPVLTSFKKVTDGSIYYDNRDSSVTLQRRASTGSNDDSSLSRNSVTPDKRPVSVYDNRPVSVYDNVNQRTETPGHRYSSPVFDCKETIPEETRYSMPTNIHTPPLPRAHKGSGSDKRLAVTGARLARSSIL